MNTKSKNKKSEVRNINLCHFDFIKDIVLILDNDIKIIYGNKIAFDVFGEDLINKKIFDIFPDASDLINAFEEVKTKNNVDFILYNYGKQSGTFNISIHYPFDIKEKNDFFITVRDISKETELQNNLNRDLEELNVLTGYLVKSYAIFKPVYSEKNEIVDFTCKYINPISINYYPYYSSDEIIGKRISEIEPNLKESGILQIYKDVIETGTPKTIEAHYLKHNIGEIDTEITAYRLFSQLALVFRDISEHKKAKKELVKTENKYKKLVDSLFEYLYTVELENGQVTSQFHSKQCEKITGYTFQEYINDPNLWFSMVHPEDKQMVLHNVETRSKEKIAIPIEHRIIHRDGSIRWIVNHASLSFNENGDLIRIDGLIQDITDRKITEQIIKESEEKYRILFDASPGSILVVRLKDSIVSAVNKKFTELIEFESDEIIGKNIRELNIWADETKRNLFLQDLNHHGEVQNYRARLRNRNNNTLECLLSARIIVYGNEPSRLVILQDITKIIQAEEQLLLLNKAIEQSVEIITITNVQGIIEYVNSSFERITGYSKEYAIGKNPRFLKSGKHNIDFYKNMWNTLRERRQRRT